MLMKQNIANIISVDLLESVKSGNSVSQLKKELLAISSKQLVQDLRTDSHKNAFWINIYNSFFILFKTDENQNNSNIYHRRDIRVSELKLSLDDIEHGILRRGKFKYGLGYIPNIFVNKAVKKHMVDKLDYRIHFALNCGAKSCPPIFSYSYINIDAQLEMATESFLENETIVNIDKKEVYITMLFKWYHGDFGGKRGIYEILKKYLDLKTKSYKLVYSKYSKELLLRNFG